MRATRGKRNYFAPPDGLRCTAHAPTTVKGEGARCMRRAMVATLCAQHWKQARDQWGGSA